MATQSLVDAKLGDVIPGDGRPTANALAHVFAATNVEIGEVHSMEPWLIARCAPGAEFRVRPALNREGFEVWHPTYKHYKPLPQRKIASNMRHKKRKALEVSRLPRFPGYILIRRLFGNFDVHRLFDIDGCIGLCVYFDGFDKYAPATLKDHDIELLRLSEHDGNYDVYNGVSEHMVLTGIVKEDPRYMEPKHFRGRVIGRLDESFRSSLFVDGGDRIVRVISARGTPDPIPAEAVGI